MYQTNNYTKQTKERFRVCVSVSRLFSIKEEKNIKASIHEAECPQTFSGPRVGEPEL